MTSLYWQLISNQQSLHSFNFRHCPEDEGLNLTFTGSNCSWSIKTDAGLKNHVINFQTDEWVDDVTMDGRYISSMFSTPDTNTLVEFQMEDSVNTTISRYFYSDRMEVRMNVNNVNASSLFKRNATWNQWNMIREYTHGFLDFTKHITMQ